jgi:hypothetical protein
MQVSDRLISTEHQRTDPPEYALSNKSIVYLALNAIVSMGYVGTAYLEGRPTDEWIAERLWGERLKDRTRDGRIGVRFGPAPSLHDIGFAVRALQTSLESLPPSPHGLFIAITGWQAVRKKNERPIFVELARRPNERPVSRFEKQRWWGGKGLVVAELGGYLTPDDLKSLAQKLSEAAKSKDLLQDFEDLLAGAARKVSATNREAAADAPIKVIARRFAVQSRDGGLSRESSGKIESQMEWSSIFFSSDSAAGEVRSVASFHESK